MTPKAFTPGTFLFIGGEYAGKVQRCDLPTVNVVVPIHPHPVRTGTYNLKYQTYEWRQIHGLRTTFPVFCWAKMSPDNMIDALLHWYAKIGNECSRCHKPIASCLDRHGETVCQP